MYNLKRRMLYCMGYYEENISRLDSYRHTYYTNREHKTIVLFHSTNDRLSMDTIRKDIPIYTSPWITYMGEARRYRPTQYIMFFEVDADKQILPFCQYDSWCRRHGGAVLIYGGDGLKDVTCPLSDVKQCRLLLGSQLSMDFEMEWAGFDKVRGDSDFSESSFQYAKSNRLAWHSAKCMLNEKTGLAVVGIPSMKKFDELRGVQRAYLTYDGIKYNSDYKKNGGYDNWKSPGKSTPAIHFLLVHVEDMQDISYTESGLPYVLLDVDKVEIEDYLFAGHEFCKLFCLQHDCIVLGDSRETERSMKRYWLRRPYS